jgi:hypothetical protein
MASRRESILTTLKARLADVQRTNDFQTDIGLCLFVNEIPELGPDDPRESVCLLMGGEQLRGNWPAVLVEAEIYVLVLVDATLTDGWVVLEQAIADVKQAIELDDDRRLSGLLHSPIERGAIETATREPGTSAMAATVPYTVRYKETWGGL